MHIEVPNGFTPSCVKLNCCNPNWLVIKARVCESVSQE
jgi:hypothetical protein